MSEDSIHYGEKIRMVTSRVLKGKWWDIETLHSPEEMREKPWGNVREEKLGSGNSKCKG